VELLQNQSDDFHVMENFQYLLDRFEKLTPPEYNPSMDDILHCRIRTLGWIEFQFNFNGVEFTIRDIAGFRNNRSKWKHRNFFKIQKKSLRILLELFIVQV
jgi:hypothetical protein